MTLPTAWRGRVEMIAPPRCPLPQVLPVWQKAAALVRSSRGGKAIVGRLLCDPRSTEHRRSSGIASKKPLPPSIGQRLLYGLGIELDEDCPEVHERASGRMPSILDMLAQVLRHSL